MAHLLHTGLMFLLSSFLVYTVTAFVPNHNRQLSFTITSIQSYGRMFASTKNDDEGVESKPHVPNVILVECGKY